MAIEIAWAVPSLSCVSTALYSNFGEVQCFPYLSMSAWIPKSKFFQQLGQALSSHGHIQYKQSQFLDTPAWIIFVWWSSYYHNTYYHNNHMKQVWMLVLVERWVALDLCVAWDIYLFICCSVLWALGHSVSQWVSESATNVFFVRKGEVRGSGNLLLLRA